MQSSSSWMIPNNSSLTTNNPSFRSNGGCRKRKADATDLDDKINQKKFVTEEKMVKEMQTLSLELSSLNNSPISTPEPIITEIKSDEDEEEEDVKIDDDNNEKETRIELHKLLKDHLKNDDLQDSFINKLCEIERKKFTMQIVPYMPIHPAQLNNDTKTIKDEEKEVIENPISSPILLDDIKHDNDDYLFKIPSIPTPYTVEEPCDNVTKRSSTMKRSYSQSDQYNSNLSVTELKPDGNEYASIHPSQSAYFIVEPSTTSLYHATSNTSSSSLSSNGPSIRITEFTENSILDVDVDDDIDMQSVASSDTGDKMDDDD